MTIKLNESTHRHNKQQAFWVECPEANLHGEVLLERAALAEVDVDVREGGISELDSAGLQRVAGDLATAGDCTGGHHRDRRDD